MTLQELIDSAPPEIRKRGQEYFDQDYVRLEGEDEDGMWSASVEGNYGMYDVGIELDPAKQVVDYWCDCPHDEPLCKHIVATAMVIMEDMTIVIPIPQQPEPEEKNQEEDWKGLVKQAKVKELRKMITEYAEKNEDFRHWIKLTLAKPPTGDWIDYVPQYKNKVAGIFEHYDYGGFIDYRSGYMAVRDVYTYLEKAQKYHAKGKLEESFGIAAAVAEEAMSAIQHMDDSSGQCSGAIYDSFELIGSILADELLTEVLRNYIFDWLHEQVKNPDYHGHGMGEHLEPLFFEVAGRLGKYEVAHEFIQGQLKYYEGKEGWGRRYHMQLYLGYQVGLLKDQDRSDEANALIANNLQFDRFREIKVTEATANGDYPEAEKLLLDGIRLSKEEGYAGTTHRWKDRLLKLYDQQTKTQEYHDLARELFLENTSNLDYYEAFKSTCTTEWNTARAQLISDMKGLRYLSTEVLANVYVKEQMIDELYHLVRESKSIPPLIQYTPHLKSKYSEELLTLYRVAINYVARNTGRDVYKNLVSYLKSMSKLKGGKEAARQLMLELLNEYRNRPAMKEELAKLGWG